MRDIIRGKTLLIGDAKVGKSTLVQRFLHSEEHFNHHYNMTIETDLQIVTINIPDTNYAVELQVIDMGGSKLFLSTRRDYMVNINNVIATYDTSNRQSFDSLVDWLDELKSAQTQEPFELNGVLLSSKSDLHQHSAVSPKEAIEFGRKYNLAAMQCSSLNNEDIDAPFNYIAQQVYLSHMQSTHNNQNNQNDNH